MICTSAWSRSIWFSRTVRAGVAGLAAVLVVASLSVTREAEAQDAPLDFGGGGTVIEGTVLAPEVTIFVARDNLLKNYNIVFEESFLDKIVESVGKPPF